MRHAHMQRPLLLLLGLKSMSSVACVAERAELLDLPSIPDPVGTTASTSETSTTAEPTRSPANTAYTDDTSTSETTSTTDSPDAAETSGTIGASSHGSPATADTSTSMLPEPSPECGNDLAEGDEHCDGVDLQGATCESLGHAVGVLVCTPTCEFDITDCAPEGMVVIPEGSFEMGSLAEPEEQPLRTVYLATFYIDATEVSVAAYAECVDAGACEDPSTGDGYNYMVPGREDHPVNGVSWYDAQAYCSWVDGGRKRLPTEAEWEKAARGDVPRTYPWGDAPDPSCLLAIMNDGTQGCGSGTTWPVGSRPLGASPYGALDMAGNVWEWVSDWYGSYDALDTENPSGPVTGSLRIFRGGGWYDEAPDFFRTTNRYEQVPEERVFSVGFRCVEDPDAVQ